MAGAGETVFKLRTFPEFESEASPKYPDATCAHSLRKALEPFRTATKPGDPSLYATGPPVDCDLLDFPPRVNPPTQELKSSLCTRHQLDSPPFRYWTMRMLEEWRLHRKLWEYCFVLQALYERQVLRPGSRGLGIGVGGQRLPALMAAMGVEIVATDDRDATDPWGDPLVNLPELCRPEDFDRLVEIRSVDMACISPDVSGFDFNWSCNALKHCRRIEDGEAFLQSQLQTLKPGGVAVHTLEYNLSSVEDTLEGSGVVLYRRGDIERLVRALQDQGHWVEPLQLDLGSSLEDAYVDMHPYSNSKHLKLEVNGAFVSTSLGLIVQKGRGLGPTEVSQ